MYVGTGLDPSLHMSCGKETLAGPNQFESPLLLSEEDSINYATSELINGNFSDEIIL
jgi:hypothetical protein